MRIRTDTRLSSTCFYAALSSPLFLISLTRLNPHSGLLNTFWPGRFLVFWSVTVGPGVSYQPLVVTLTPTASLISHDEAFKRAQNLLQVLIMGKLLKKGNSKRVRIRHEAGKRAKKKTIKSDHQEIYIVGIMDA
ncbi:hypothetical protein ACTXT7_007807 [Hymenolepis weldensis]